MNIDAKNALEMSKPPYGSKKHFIMMKNLLQGKKDMVFDQCGQSSGRNPIPQVAGKPTLRALQFDPNNFQI